MTPLPGDKDDYILTDGGVRGQRRLLTGDQRRSIVGVDVAGRLYTRA